MSDPVRVPSRPAQPGRAGGGKYRLPEDAIPPEELAVLDKRAAVAGEDVLAWLNGEGPDPWQSGGSR